MASAYKILGQQRFGVSRANVIPTVAAGKSYIVSSLVISSAPKADSTNVQALDIFAVKSGGVVNANSAIAYGIPIELDTDLTLTMGITLGEGDRLTVGVNSYLNDYPYTDYFTATAFGEEITV